MSTLEPNPDSASSPYYTSEALYYTTPSSDASGRRFSARRPSEINRDYFPDVQRDAQLTQDENDLAQRERQARLTQEQAEAADAAGSLLELSSPPTRSDSSNMSFSWDSNVGRDNERRWSQSGHNTARRSIEDGVSPTSGVRVSANSGMQPVTTVPASLPSQARSSTLGRVGSAVDSTANETPGPLKLRCAFEEPGSAEPCIMNETARKCTSEKFGRNKACTKKLEAHWWNWTCRKHYQRKKYEASHNGRFPAYQHEQIVNQINKFLTFAHSFEFDIKWQLNLGATVEEYQHMLRVGYSPESALQVLTSRHGSSSNSQVPNRQAAMNKYKAELDIAIKVNYLCGDYKTVDQVFVFLERMYEQCQKHSDIKELELPHIEFLPKRWVLHSVSRNPFTVVSRPSQFAPRLEPLTTRGAQEIRRLSDPEVLPLARHLSPPTSQRLFSHRRESEFFDRRLSETGQGRLATPPSSLALVQQPSVPIVPLPVSGSMPPPPLPSRLSRRSRRSPAPSLTPLQTNLGAGYGPVRNHATSNPYGFAPNGHAGSRTTSYRASPYPPRM